MTAHTWPPGTIPSPEQLDEYLTTCSPTERLELLERAVDAQERAAACFVSNHDGRLERAEAGLVHLTEQLEQARSIACRLEAELAERPVAGLELVAGRTYLIELNAAALEVPVVDDRLEWLRDVQERLGCRFVVVDGTVRDLELDEAEADGLLASLEARLAGGRA